jgi:hypothetical protein
MAVHRKAQEDVLARSRGAIPVLEVPRYEEYCLARSRPGQYFLCGWVGATCNQYSPSSAAAGNDGFTLVNLANDVAASGTQITAGGLSAEAPAAEKPTAGLGTVTLGRRLEMLTRTDADPSSAATGGSPVLIDSYELHAPAEAAPPLCIRGSGWFQSYLIFGGPGAGKTYLYTRLLAQVLSAPAATPPGALILDPKGVLQSRVRQLARDIGRSDDLTVIDGRNSDTGSAVNLLGCSALRPRDLGRVVSEVVLAEAGALADGWQVFVSDLLESATVLIHAEQGLVTPAMLAGDLLQRDAAGDRLIVARARRLFGDPRPEVQEAVQRLTSYFGEHTEERVRQFVRQVIEQTIGELKNERWASLSDPAGLNIYDEMVSGRRILLLSIGQASPAFQRCLCSLVKALFQQTVLATEIPEGNDEQFRVLACDEYAQVATEGTSGLVSDSAFFSLSREYHCLSLLALQSAATGRSRFPGHLRDRWDAILGNIGAKIFMRLNDVETAQLASEHVGDRQILVPLDAISSGSTERGVTHNLATAQRRAVPHWVLTQVLRTGQALAIGTLDGGRTVGWNFFEVDS